MASDKQIAANQANAIKSTGPKTAQGKATARRNALKHGMTCRNENLLADDAKLYKERLESWTKSTKPRNDMELYQVQRAVRAAVNLDRCDRNATADMDRRKRSASGHWEGVQTKKIDKILEGWTTAPAACVAQLETFARGCELLIGQWDELSEALEQNESWTIQQARLAIRLMGERPEEFLDGRVGALRTLVIAALPDIDPDEVDAFLGMDTSQLDPETRNATLNDKLPSQEDAREGLWAILDGEFERLAPILEKLWEHDGPELSEQVDRASFDASKTGVLRRRYESANHMDMHRSLKQFAEQRRQSELRVQEQEEIDEKAEAARLAEIHKQTTIFMRDRERRLRNEAKLSATKDRQVSTSGKSADVDPKPNTAPVQAIPKVAGPTEAASEGVRPSDPADSGAGEPQKPA